MGINGGTGIVGSGAALGGSGIHINRGGGGSGFDPDAQAFIDAALITGATQQSALNQLVLDLKGTGSTTNGTDVWSKCYALYPMSPSDEITISLTTIKWNLKDPRDLNAAFRLTFFSSPNVSITTGLDQNESVNGYANTHFIENDNMTAGSSGFTLSYYKGATGYIIGDNTTNIYAFREGVAARLYSGSQLVTLNPSPDGIYTMSRLSATDLKGYIDANLIDSNITSSVLQATNDCYVLATNASDSPAGLSGSSCGFLAIHDGLTANEVQDIYDAITAWNTSIGR